MYILRECDVGSNYKCNASALSKLVGSQGLDILYSAGLRYLSTETRNKTGNRDKL